MADIWDRVARALDSDVDAALWNIRQHPGLAGMDSELERAFTAYVVMSFRIGQLQIVVGEPQPSDGTKGVFLVPQVVVGKYRVDFVLGWLGKTERHECLAVELDGHDWHEKTKQQAARDKARDRFLSAEFGKVVHFTGSEFFRDPQAVAVECMEMLGVVHGLKKK